LTKYLVMNVSVIIPAHNEEEVIKKMVTMLLAVYGKYIGEVIVVNDGSTDQTAAIVKKLAKSDKRIRLVNRTPPHGVGLALREGIVHVSKKATHIFTLDADFIRNLPDLEDFFLRIKDYDGLIGSRYLAPYSLIRYPLLKKIANRGFHFFVRVLYGVQHHDLTNNFKLYTRKLYLSIPLSEDGFAVNAQTGLYPILMGYNIGELPVTWYARERDMGYSKFKLLSVAPGYVRVLLKTKHILST
jgi:dolichol-phosphate mannosyltransferase